MTKIYLASLLLCAGAVLLLGYAQSIGARPLYLRISQRSKPKPSAARFLQGFSGLLSIRQASGKRDLGVMFELPDFLDLFSVALSSGESVYSALNRVVPRMTGAVAKEFEGLLLALELGSDFETELAQMSTKNVGNPLSEVANRLSLANRRGTPIAQLLTSQAIFVRRDFQNHMLQLSGRNETRMLIPLVFLILPVTILFAIFPSLEMLGGIYI